MCYLFGPRAARSDSISRMTVATPPDRMLVSALMANISEHIFCVDRDSRCIAVSRSLEQYMGRGAAEILGTTAFDFVDEATAKAYRERDLKIMSTGEALSDQLIKNTWADGHVTWTMCSMLPLRHESGEIFGVLSISKDITAAKLMEQELERANRELREMSRLAGMAEAATGVLHNVGNVLNGVNVSSNILAQGLRNLKVDQLGKLCTLLRQHIEDIGEFMASNSQGRRVVDFLEAFERDLSAHRANMLNEVNSLEQGVGHIKEIVSIQQSYATMKGLVEDIEVSEVVEDALKMSQGAFLRHGVKLRREFGLVPKITGERGKILKILHNLLRNAKHAVDESSVIDKAIEVRIEAGSAGMVRVIVSDNGVGIELENLTRIFGQGFTTRRAGHGFGLHSAANAAREMRGSLSAQSDGPGTGATFILELPLARAAAGVAGDEVARL